MKTHIVVTGLGLLGNFGAGKDNFIRFLSDPAATTIAIDGIDFDAHIDTLAIRRADYISKCALTAAVLAMKDANLVANKEKNERMGIILGTVHGALNYTLEYHASLVCGDPKIASPLFFSESVANAAASHISTTLGIRGYTTTTSGYCSVLQALQLGVELIQQGALDICLVGGADINNDFLAKAYRDCLHNPELIIDNFGGSGFIVIESLAHAMRRKASLYAKIEGVSIVTTEYNNAKQYDISPLNELLCQTGIKLRKHDYVLNASYNDKDSMQRKDLYLQTFKNAQCVILDSSSKFEYGFSAAEAFQLILGILGVYSMNYLSSFNKFDHVTKYIERLFVIRTALAGASGCAVFLHCT